MVGTKPSATRHSVETPSGRISYTEQGTGPVALFVHGVLLNGHLWRPSAGGFVRHPALYRG
jgi:pimeloyl-ACP methyl ester carboxylesterase